jgi:hypothetical protein
MYKQIHIHLLGCVKNLSGGVGNLSEGAQKDIELLERWSEIFSLNGLNFSASIENLLERCKIGQGV